MPKFNGVSVKPPFQFAMLQIRKNIYRSDVQVTFEMYGPFRRLQVLYSIKKLHLHSPVTGEFPTQGPVTRSFDIIFDVHLS